MLRFRPVFPFTDRSEVDICCVMCAAKGAGFVDKAAGWKFSDRHVDPAFSEMSTMTDEYSGFALDWLERIAMLKYAFPISVYFSKTISVSSNNFRRFFLYAGRSHVA